MLLGQMKMESRKKICIFCKVKIKNITKKYEIVQKVDKIKLKGMFLHYRIKMKQG